MTNLQVKILDFQLTGRPTGRQAIAHIELPGGIRVRDTALVRSRSDAQFAAFPSFHRDNEFIPIVEAPDDLMAAIFAALTAEYQRALDAGVAE